MQLFDYPQTETFGAQTELDSELFLHSGTGASFGMDASTQVNETDVSNYLYTKSTNYNYYKIFDYNNWT